MGRIALFIAGGCEEIEALTVTDVVRRAKLDIDMVSIAGNKTVTGSHGITFETDVLVEDADMAAYDAVVLPGGLPGTTNLGAHPAVVSAITSFAAAGKVVAAICAAPSVLGENGLLKGKRATCHPGWEEKLTGALTSEDEVVIDGNIITSRGMATAIPFALAIVERFAGDEAAKKVAGGIVYKG